MPSTDRPRTLTRNMTSNPVETEVVAAVQSGLPYGLTDPTFTDTAVDRFYIETVAQAQLDITEHGIVNFVNQPAHYATLNIGRKRWPLARLIAATDRRSLSRLAHEINAVEWEADDQGQAFASSFDEAVTGVLTLIYVELYATIAAHLGQHEPVLLWDHETNRLTYNYDAN